MASIVEGKLMRLMTVGLSLEALRASQLRSARPHRSRRSPPSSFAAVLSRARISPLAITSLWYREARNLHSGREHRLVPDRHGGVKKSAPGTNT
jgi:hypothetical protein